MKIKDKMLKYVAKLTPADHLSAVIRQFCDDKRISRSTMGVHIRKIYPDSDAISIEVFIKQIDKALDSVDNIFLATDWDNARTLLTARYGNRIASYRVGKWRRDTRQAICDAIVDLYILARTRRLLGCGYSTFSDMAWWLGGCAASLQYVHRGQQSF